MKKKAFNFSVIILISLVLAGCNTLYKRYSLKSVRFYGKYQNKDLSGKELHVFDGPGSYYLKNPVIQGDTLYGQIEKPAPGTEIFIPLTKKELKEHKDDVNIYLYKPLTDSISGSKVKISGSNVVKVDIYKPLNFVPVVIISVVVYMLIVAAIVFLLIYVIKALFTAITAALIIAACSGSAAYQSRTAPQLDVLRKFRDRFLVKSAPGRLIVKTYYAGSAIINPLVQRSELTRKSLRFLIDNFVKFLLRFNTFRY